MKLTSDEHGKVVGSYVFTDADALDTYTLQIPGYKGSAKLLLGEYRKSKIRLKISGDVTDEKLDLKFETVDFLDKPVRRVQAQLHRPGGREDARPTGSARSRPRTSPTSPRSGRYSFDLDDLPEEDRLLWIADGVPPRGAGNFQAVVAQFQHDLALAGAEPGKHTIDLKKEWKTGNFVVQVQGVVTDANGREQRATHTISLKCDKALPKQKLEVAKEIFVTGEKILARLTTEDGKAPEGATSLVVMKLSPAPLGGLRRLRVRRITTTTAAAATTAATRGTGGTTIPKEEPAKRTLVTALPLRNDAATVKLTEPGAYKLVAVTHHDDGRTTQCEAGLVVKNSEDLTPFALRLDKDEYAAGDRLGGTIFSRYAGARVLLTLRDSSGIRLAKPYTLNDKGVARIDEAIPAGIKYACTVDLHYPDEKGFNHVLGRMVRVTPTDRMLNVTAKVKDEVKPGEVVQLDLQVDRKEEVDLVVSVYDQSLLGINPDKSVDIRNFYLADERVRTMQAKDLLRRKLGDVTLEAVLKRADEILKGDPNPNDPPAQNLKAVVDHVRNNKYLYSPHLITLLRLAGVEVVPNPVWYAYHGNSWHYHTQDLLKKPLREIVEHKHGDYYLVFGLAGDTLMMHEMHPSWVNINPMHYYGRYCGRLMYENGLNQFAGYGRRRAGQGFGGRGGARGDAHHSISGNSSGSFIPEGQGFISHMPVGPAAPAHRRRRRPGAHQRPPRLLRLGLLERHGPHRQGRQGERRVQGAGLADQLAGGRHRRVAEDARRPGQGPVPHVQADHGLADAAADVRRGRPGRGVRRRPQPHRRGAEHQGPAQGRERRDPVAGGEDGLGGRQVERERLLDFVARQPGFTQLLMSVDCPDGSDASLKRLPVIRAAAEQVITAVRPGARTGRRSRSRTTWTCGRPGWRSASPRRWPPTWRTR